MGKIKVIIVLFSLFAFCFCAPKKKEELADETLPSVTINPPTAPANLALGTAPTNYGTSPTITYSPSAADSSLSLLRHEVRITKTSDDTVVLDWTAHMSGDAVTTTTYQAGTDYTVSVRGVDSANTAGTAVTSTWSSISDPCSASPTPGTTCTGGTIYLGNRASDRYMTTPGGCTDIPPGSVSGGSGTTSYALEDFTPLSCTGTDSLHKRIGSGTYDIPGIINYPGTMGTSSGNINIDANYGSANTAAMVAITSGAQGGPYPAARYCDKLFYGGYRDWYLPNRYELHLFRINVSSIPGVFTGANWYISSSEISGTLSWIQAMSDGNQTSVGKDYPLLLRCVRRY